jgi:putative nucleotidyltransferase with HDIG domain
MSLAEPVPSPASAAPADVAHSPARPPWLRFDDVGLPVLPTVAQRVIELAGDPSASVATLANIVSKEQVLASRVLAYANSAQHCPLGNVSTVRTAIVRLGTGIVRGVVMAECFASRLYDPGTYGETGRALADHALGTAYTARLVAERVGIDLEEAFLCGLLHDVGKLVVLKLARDHERRSGRTLEREDVETAMTAHHAALGGLVLKKWRLPDALDEPVRFHRDGRALPGQPAQPPLRLRLPRRRREPRGHAGGRRARPRRPLARAHGRPGAWPRRGRAADLRLRPRAPRQ